MAYLPQNFEILRRDVQRMVENRVDSIGIYSRIFSRIKDPKSTERKICEKRDVYSAKHTKMQDFLGIRVTVYFEDDVENVARILKNQFRFDSESVDIPDSENFKPKRHNLVFKLPPRSFERNPIPELIDDTFEIQIRTILSEGWHEVEHDLRYKNKGQWLKQPIQSRGLNSILAALEMCDWGISKLTDEMAYAAYKSKDLSSLVLNKFRLRLVQTPLDEFFLQRQDDPEFLKKVLRAKRDDLVSQLSAAAGSIPINTNNLLWVLAKTQKITAFNDDEFPSPLRDILVECNSW